MVPGNQKGYSVTEMVIVVAIVGVLAAVAIPPFMQMRSGLEYRQVSRDIASALREARNKAITTNRQHRLEFDPVVPCRRYRVTQGDRAYNSAVWTTNQSWITIPQSVTLSTIPNLANIEFNPNGTAANLAPAVSVTINIMDTAAAVKHRAQVTSIGKITIL
jgi:prepilin-type N-terminal cleavage/methylation domain-containing protein